MLRHITDIAIKRYRLRCFVVLSRSTKTGICHILVTTVAYSPRLGYVENVG